MIYHEIAIDPESFEDLKDLGLLERLFGFEHGRLVALLPAKGKNGIQEEKNWKLLVKQHLTRLLPGKSKEIELRLDRIMDRCVWRSRGQSKHDPVQPWRSLARDEHKQREFAAILCSETGLCCHPEYSYQGMHFPPEAYPDFLRAPIHVADSLKSPDVFLENLRPLITSAKRITFIDPYFNPLPEMDGQASVWLNTLKKLASFLTDSNRKTIDIDIHAKSPEYDATKDICRINMHPLDFINRSISVIEGWFPKETTLSIACWSERHRGQKFHARYLITDKAGVAVEYGLDLKHDQRTDVSLLPVELAKKRLMDFDFQNPSLFELDARESCKGTR
ncbi:MAG: hypothetical protein NTV46_16040 [Verrucomicrobia bacterium]|nr:hypothetical protein [Verrucomicrobiota bacterium]